jgi:uncharacterized protein YndB with AHSA1/START domain
MLSAAMACAVARLPRCLLAKLRFSILTIAQNTASKARVAFTHSAERIYRALTDAEQFQATCRLSDAAKQVDVNSRLAKISGQSGGEFTIFGGYIAGRHIELAPNQRIVQAWREPRWDVGVYSLVHFQLSNRGKKPA